MSTYPLVGPCVTFLSLSSPYRFHVSITCPSLINWHPHPSLSPQSYPKISFQKFLVETPVVRLFSSPVRSFCLVYCVYVPPQFVIPHKPLKVLLLVATWMSRTPFVFSFVENLQYKHSTPHRIGFFRNSTGNDPDCQIHIRLPILLFIFNLIVFLKSQEDTVIYVTFSVVEIRQNFYAI